MSSPIYFDFLSSVWDQLPEEDREAFAELWQGYEQVIAAAYQRSMELNLNIAVNDLQPWTTERWIPHTFNTSNYILRPASMSSNQDLSMGVNTTNKYLLKLSVDQEEPIEINIKGLIPVATKIDEIILKINLAFGFKFASSIYEGTIIKLTSRTSGADSLVTIWPTSVPEANACEFVLGVDPDMLPVSYPQFRYPYTLAYQQVASIPQLRDAIRDESVTTLLTEGVDYILDDAGIVFKEIPPENMWAERTQINEENPWNNYGFLTDIYQKNSARYVGVIQGLWFALWNGPKPSNLRISLYLLFGLPTAPEPCTVSATTVETSVTVDGFTTVTPGTIVLLGDSGTTYNVTIPSGLNAEVVAGDKLYKFQPLVDGIQVFDKINYPGFIEKEIGREGINRFLTENASSDDAEKAMTMLEQYTYLPQISVEAFVYPDINLANVKTFLDSFRPLNKTYLFQVIVGSFRDLIGLNDPIGGDIDIDLTSNLDSNETTFLRSSLTYRESAPYLHDVTFTDYEGGSYKGLDLDPAGIVFDEKLEIEVRRSGTLIDSMTA